MADDRAAREERVVETVRQWLPDLIAPGAAIQITAADPGDPRTPDGALFTVTKTQVFACSRGSGR